MTKTEFLSQLKRELTGNINPQAVQENIEYYDRYIMDEVRSGKSEEDVVQILGDPWVLAQTLIGVKNSADEIYEDVEKTYSHMGGVARKEKSMWWKKLLGILFVIMIILCVVAIMTGLIRLLAPVFLPVAIVMLVIRLIKGR